MTLSKSREVKLYMKIPELKIIVGAIPSDCKVYIDDEQIGLNQN